jgi:putative ABC transport system ATP-binding protein
MKDKISYSFQEPLLIPYLTVLENITSILSVSSERAVETLSNLGMMNRLRHKPSTLSVGEKKKVDIARAVLKGSSILIADEPLSNLDPSSSLKVMNLLKEHSQNGGTTIYSSVNETDARFADYIMHM